jgi:hypothetical protein
MRKWVENIFHIVFTRTWSVWHVVHIWADCNCLFTWSYTVHKCWRLLAFGSPFQIRPIVLRLIIAWSQKPWCLYFTCKETVEFSLLIGCKSH